MNLLGIRMFTQVRVNLFILPKLKAFAGVLNDHGHWRLYEVYYFLIIIKTISKVVPATMATQSIVFSR